MTEEFKKARDDAYKESNAMLLDAESVWQHGAEWAYEWFRNNHQEIVGAYFKEHKDLEQKLAIAVEALERFDFLKGCNCKRLGICNTCKAEQALSKIKGDHA